MDKTKQGPIHDVRDRRNAEQRFEDKIRRVEDRNPKLAEKLRAFIQGTAEPTEKK